MKYSLFLLCLLIVLACTRSDDTAPSNKLIGTWRLTTYCKPATSSTCTTISVPTDKAVFVTFDNAGTFNEYYENTKPADYSFLGCGNGTYAIEGEQVRIKALCMSSLQGGLAKIISVDTRQLVLNPFGTGEYLFVKQ